MSEEVSAGQLSWLKQKKFLKVMNSHARLSLQGVHSILENPEQNQGFSTESTGIVISLEQVDSGEKDWNEAAASVSLKSGIAAPSTVEIGSHLPPLALIQRLPNTSAGHVSREFGITGPCLTLGGDDPGGLNAILQGARWIAGRECDQVIVVRVEEEAAMIAMLASSPAGTDARQILSWSHGEPAAVGVVTGILKLRTIGDWQNWLEAKFLGGDPAGPMIRLGPVQP